MFIIVYWPIVTHYMCLTLTSWNLENSITLFSFKCFEPFLRWVIYADTHYRGNIFVVHEKDDYNVRFRKKFNDKASSVRLINDYVSTELLSTNMKKTKMPFFYTYMLCSRYKFVQVISFLTNTFLFLLMHVYLQKCSSLMF